MSMLLVDFHSFLLQGVQLFALLLFRLVESFLEGLHMLPLRLRLLLDTAFPFREHMVQLALALFCCFCVSGAQSLLTGGTLVRPHRPYWPASAPIDPIGPSGWAYLGGALRKLLLLL